MVSKNALEEHFGATDPNIVEQSAEHFQADAWPAHRDMLLDIHEERLRIMNSCDIEKTVLSLLAPAIPRSKTRSRCAHVNAPSPHTVPESSPVSGCPSRFRVDGASRT
jgi:hypothetical protein